VLIKPKPTWISSSDPKTLRATVTLGTAGYSNWKPRLPCCGPRLIVSMRHGRSLPKPREIISLRRMPLGPWGNGSFTSVWSQLKPAFTRAEIEAADRKENIIQASRDLGRDLFEKRDDLGYVGCGVNNIDVYAYASEETWKAKFLTDWKGYPVLWHYSQFPLVSSLASLDGVGGHG
jgi:hypothetical protein